MPLRRIEKCRSCGAEVVWLDTRDPATSRMIVDAETAAEDDILFDRTRHRPHWATCPDAARWRKKR